MKNVAFLWWEEEVDFSGEKPFGDESWKNQSYAKYTEMLEDRGLKVVCGEYRWYSQGRMEKAFYWNGDQWEKEKDIEIEGIYDLFRHDEQKLELKKRMNQETGILNHPELAEICQDKLETFETFSDHMPETRKASNKNIQEILEKYDKAVIKPRYGSSGEKVQVIKEALDSPPDNMLVQEFVECDKLPQHGIDGVHDLRILVVDNETIGAYFRVPDEGLISNVALGGSKIYVNLEELPQQVFDIIEDVSSTLNQYEPAIYTVDFMISDGRPRIVELNSQPGVYYHGESRKEEWERPWMEEISDLIAEEFS